MDAAKRTLTYEEWLHECITRQPEVFVSWNAALDAARQAVIDQLGDEHEAVRRVLHDLDQLRKE